MLNSCEGYGEASSCGRTSSRIPFILFSFAATVLTRMSRPQVEYYNKQDLKSTQNLKRNYNEG